MHKLALAAVFFALSSYSSVAQTTLFSQSGNAGDNWNFLSTGADATASAEALSALNYTSAPQSLVIGGNTGGGSCIDGGSGNGPSTPRTYTFDGVDISSSNQFSRTLLFNWGNRHPVCTGTGWDTGENLIFIPIHDGAQQGQITLASGINDAIFSILNNSFSYNVPPCVNNFGFILSITTNRRDELLLLDDVLLTTPSYNQQQDTNYVSLSICSNQLPLNWNGLQIVEAGEYLVNLPSETGCDSLILLTLEVQSSLIENITVSVCESDFPYNFNGNQITASGTFQYAFQNGAGCDSIVNLNVLLASIYQSSNTLELCSNELPYTWQGQSLTDAGNYAADYTTQFGCDSSFLLTLIVNQQPQFDVTFSSTTVPINSTEIIVNNNSTNAPIWFWETNAEGITIGSGFSPTIILPSEIGSYQVTLTLENENCINVEIFNFTVVVPDYIFDVTVPNVITPNNDGKNDFFEIDFGAADFRELFVVNRWGDLVFTTQDSSIIWNGVDQKSGTTCTDGVYFYQLLLANPLNGSEQIFHGFVHIVR